MASIIGTSSGTSASAARMECTSASNSVHSTLAFVAKYRKKVRSLTPASAVICSIVVLSNPFSTNSRSAIWRSSRELVAGGRPRLGV
jgi:hypothetical protein